MLLAGEDPTVLSANPNLHHHRARSPGMMAGDDDELAINNNNAATGEGAHLLLDVSNNRGGGGTGVDSTRDGNSETQMESRLSSYNKQGAGAAAGGSYNDRDATASVGVAIDEEDENASAVLSMDNNTVNGDQESSRMATAGGSQLANNNNKNGIVDPTATSMMDPDRPQEKGQPTQQQL